MSFVIALLLGAVMGAVIVGGLWATFSTPMEPEAVEEREERSAIEQVMHSTKTINDAWQGQAAWAEVMERGRQIQILEERKTDA